MEGLLLIIHLQDAAMVQELIDLVIIALV